MVSINFRETTTVLIKEDTQMTNCTDLKSKRLETVKRPPVAWDQGRRWGEAEASHRAFREDSEVEDT